jgi:hypothetical protein
MATSTTTKLDGLIGICILSITGLAGAHIVAPTELDYALLALIAGRLGVTPPSPPAV